VLLLSSREFISIFTEWRTGWRRWRVSVLYLSKYARLTKFNSGGYGTSGANGGIGGNVRTTVPEGDLDLLLAVTADIHGGGGGAVGRHGAPGYGGPGGRGGASYSWYVIL